MMWALMLHDYGDHTVVAVSRSKTKLVEYVETHEQGRKKKPIEFKWREENERWYEPGTVSLPSRRSGGDWWITPVDVL